MIVVQTIKTSPARGAVSAALAYSTARIPNRLVVVSTFAKVPIGFVASMSEAKSTALPIFAPVAHCIWITTIIQAWRIFSAPSAMDSGTAIILVTTTRTRGFYPLREWNQANNSYSPHVKIGVMGQISTCNASTFPPHRLQATMVTAKRVHPQRTAASSEAGGPHSSKASQLGSGSASRF